MSFSVPKNLKYSLGPLGRLLLIIGVVLLLPIIVGIIYSNWIYKGSIVYWGFIIPSIAAFLVGIFFEWRFETKELSLVQGLFLTGLAWIIISFFCAFPFVMIQKMNFINAYFEAVSGFTTTGITMIVKLEPLPESLIFYRSLIQWIGGLGIITFFLYIGLKGISEHIMYRGESHKIESSRPVPNLRRTVKYLWIIYGGFTFALIALLWIEGVGLYDAVNHAFTTLSTGGFSPHSSSITFYRNNAFMFPNFRLIEYTITAFMILGGTNFVIHYQVFKGNVRSLWNNMEMKLWWLIIGGATFFIMFETGAFNELFYASGSLQNFEQTFRNAVFQVGSIASSTGFETKWINTFGPLAKQIFLVLMVIGGCVSSTGGGFKVRRVGIMMKGVWNRIKRASRPREMMTPLLVDGSKVDRIQLERIFIIFATWIFLLAIGGFLTALFSSQYNALQCYSGMFSALGNTGPSYFSVSEMAGLNPIIKILYTFAMLVGRLEVLPVFILLNKEVWE